MVTDIRHWAKDRLRACPHSTADASAAPLGWRQAEPVCAWRNLLQVRRWHSDADDGSGCVSPQARWWAWSQAAERADTPQSSRHPAWRAAWQAQSMIPPATQVQRVVVLQRVAGSGWRATEWRWAPSERVATRTWQTQRWQILLDAARALQPALARPDASQQIDPLMAAWERNLNGRAGDVAPGAWRWESGAVCMTVDLVGLSAAQPHLPHAANEGRLEQRSAMQLRLARRYPGAQWITPFRLLPTPLAPAHGGAVYEAVWLDGGQLRGQLWLPRKTDGAVARLRISARLPSGDGKRARDADIERLAGAISRELSGIAATWKASNE